MTKTVVALYDSASDAETVSRELSAAGFTDTEIVDNSAIGSDRAAWSGTEEPTFPWRRALPVLSALPWVLFRNQERPLLRRRFPAVSEPASPRRGSGRRFPYVCRGCPPWRQPGDRPSGR